MALSSGLSVSQGLALAAGSSLQAKGAYLAAKSGLCGSVALAWVTKENGVGNNVLGVGYSNGHLPTFPTWQQGLDAAVAAVQSSSYYAGIRAAIASGDCCKQRDAIIDSPWSGDFYGAKLSGGPHFPSVAGCGAYAGRWAGAGGGGSTLPPTTTGPTYTADQWNQTISCITAKHPQQVHPAAGSSGTTIQASWIPDVIACAAANGIALTSAQVQPYVGQTLSAMRDGLAAQGVIPPASIDLNPLDALGPLAGAVVGAAAPLIVGGAVVLLIVLLGYKGLTMILEG